MSKLDRLVAERVMGWPTIDFAAKACNGGYIRSECAYRGADHPTDRCGHWQPSTEIAAAWEVVEHLRKQTLADGLSSKYQVSLIDDGELWECLIEDNGSGQCWSGFDESPSLAICYAVLLAFGVDEATIQEAMR